MRSGASTGVPSVNTRCNPMRSPGKSRARRTASAVAGAPIIRLAADSVPVRLASSTASFIDSCRPKSSAVRIRKRSGGMRAQETEKLDTFAQAPLGQVPTGEHLPDQLTDLARPEIEA